MIGEKISLIYHNSWYNLIQYHNSVLICFIKSKIITFISDSDSYIPYISYLIIIWWSIQITIIIHGGGFHISHFSFNTNESPILFSFYMMPHPFTISKTFPTIFNNQEFLITYLTIYAMNWKITLTCRTFGRIILQYFIVNNFMINLFK